MPTSDAIALALTALIAAVIGYLLGRRPQLVAELRDLRNQHDERGRALAAAQATLEAERRQGAEKLALLQGAREELALQFKALATEVLEAKSQRFTELNTTSLATILGPLKTDLAGFKEKVESLHVADTRDRAALAEQVRLLSELNGTLRTETTNLTRALTGDSKVQGDWGEMVLDQLLHNAGLIEGEHFTRQATHTNADGARVIPDIVLHLPQGRDLVVDSKVSLTAYAAAVAEPDAARRDQLLQAHVQSVKGHIKELSDKRYHELYQLTSVDFVMLFLPVEGAFSAALTAQRDLYQYAHERNVLLVSPSTMLFAVRTIAHVWRQEAQSRNAIEIADRGAKLYDKFVAFTEDLAEVGKHLERATRSYEDAQKKLHEGNGNLVTQVQQLEALGVKAKKRLEAPGAS